VSGAGSLLSKKPQNAKIKKKEKRDGFNGGKEGEK